MKEISAAVDIRGDGLTKTILPSSVKSSNQRLIGFFLFLLIYVIVSYLVVNRSFAVISVWALVTCILLPGVLLTLYLGSASLKLFIVILFCTQFVGAPAFVSNRQGYAYAGWAGIKDFNFSLPEFFYVYLPAGIFFLLVPVLFFLLRLAFSRGGELAKKEWKKSANRGETNPSTEILFTLGVVLLIVLHAWMFRYRIGMVGVTPPRLPLHMSGILSYATKFLFPFLLVYFYTKSRRSLYLTLLLLVYAFILGLSQVSRSSGMFILLPVALLAMMDRRPILIAMTLLWSAICIQFSTLMREIVYEGRSLRSGDAYSLWDAGLQLVSDLKLSTELFTAVPLAILNRIESPQNLVLGYQFQADAVGGIWRVLLSLFREGMGQIDSRAYTLEWCGVLISDDYGFRGGLLSNIVIAGAAGTAWLLLATAYVSLCIFIIETLARRIFTVTASNVAYWTVCMVGVLIVLLAIGTPTFWGFFIVCTLVAFTPPLGLLRRN